MKKTIKIRVGKKNIEVVVRKLGFFGRIRGLMFRSKKTENLLFEFPFDSRWAIHSYFVFFDFYAVWLDGKGNVVDILLVKPWRFSVIPRKKFRKLVEIPVNNRNSKIITFLVGKGKHLNTSLTKKY